MYIYRNSVQVTQQLKYNNLGVRDGYILKPKITNGVWRKINYFA